MLVAPGDTGALTDALRSLLDDARRQEALVAAGTTRAAEFSMARLAEAFVERYEAAGVIRHAPSGSASRRPL